MNYVTVSLKDILPSNQKAVIKFKMTPAKKIDLLMQSKILYDMLSQKIIIYAILKSIKKSVVVDENSPELKITGNKNNFIIQSCILSKQLSRQDLTIKSKINFIIEIQQRIKRKYKFNKLNYEKFSFWKNICRQFNQRDLLIKHKLKQNSKQDIHLNFYMLLAKEVLEKQGEQNESQQIRICFKRNVKNKVLVYVLNIESYQRFQKHKTSICCEYGLLFQDRENLYLVLDLLRGGDLRYHIGRMKKFSEEQTKFFACCIILLSLQYLHQPGIIHRDAKPENLSIDGNYNFQSQISADIEPQDDSSKVLNRNIVQDLFEGYKSNEINHKSFSIFDFCNEIELFILQMRLFFFNIQKQKNKIAILSVTINFREPQDFKCTKNEEISCYLNNEDGDNINSQGFSKQKVQYIVQVIQINRNA